MNNLARRKDKLDVVRIDDHISLLFKYPTSGVRLTRQEALDLVAVLTEFANDITPPLSAA